MPVKDGDTRIEQISEHAMEAIRLLDAGIIALLKQAAKDDFTSLAAPFRSWAQQTARLVGVASDDSATGPGLPVAMLLPRLEALVSAAERFAKVTRAEPEGPSSDPRVWGEWMERYLAVFVEAARRAGNALALTAATDLLEHKATVTPLLTAWSEHTDTLHAQLQAQLGAAHLATVTALQARTEAAAAYGNSMLRMGMSRFGAQAFDKNVGPLVASLRRMFGST